MVSGLPPAQAVLAAFAAQASYSVHSASLFRRRRPLFWLALLFCAGIACDAWLAPPLAPVRGIALTVALVLAVLLLWRRRMPAVGTHTVLFVALVAAFAAGALTHALRARIPASDDISRLTPPHAPSVLLRGTVVETVAAPTQGGRAPRDTWTIAVEALGTDDAPLQSASGCVRVRAARDTAAGADGVADIGEGDVLELRAELHSLPELTLPGGFDYGAYLRRQGITRVGVVLPGGVQRLSGPRWYRVDLRLRRASVALSQRAEELLPKAVLPGRAEGSQAALLNALLFGRRERMDASDREAFTLSGTAHLLAISGLQIHFLAVMLWWLCSALGLSRRKAAWLVGLSACGYCALGGADAPIMRATVMVVLYLAAVVCWREPDSQSVLGGAALAILVVSPAELFNAGFQLSFLAVLALLTIYPALEEAWQAWRLRAAGIAPVEAAPLGPWLLPLGQPARFRLSHFTRQALFVSLAAWVGTAPVVAWHMGRFATFSLLINLIAVPLSNFCMVCGLVMLAVGAVSATLAAAAGWVAWLSLATLQWLNGACAMVPAASLDVPPPAIVVLAAYGAAWGWVWWVRRSSGAALWRVAAVLASCLLLLPAGLLHALKPQETGVTVLDLSAGRAALVEAPGCTVLIDAGAPWQGAALAEVLRRRGTSRLELLVLTADNHDAIGGAVEVLKRVPAARVVLPRACLASPARRELESLLRERGTPYGTPRELFGASGGAFEAADIGVVRLSFCDDGPPHERPAAPKSDVCVRVALPGVSVLFANAASGAALDRLLSKAAPRGGATADDGAFLRADVLRLSAGAAGLWPLQTRELVRRSGCGVAIAGGAGGPEDALALGLAGLPEARGVLVLSPRREGTLRVVCGGNGGHNPGGLWHSAGYAVHAFRGGTWRELRPRGRE